MPIKDCPLIIKHTYETHTHTNTYTHTHIHTRTHTHTHIHTHTHTHTQTDAGTLYRVDYFNEVYFILVKIVEPNHTKNWSFQIDELVRKSLKHDLCMYKLFVLGNMVKKKVKVGRSEKLSGL